MTIEELEKSIKETVSLAVCAGCDCERCYSCKKVERFEGYVEEVFKKYKISTI